MLVVVLRNSGFAFCLAKPTNWEDFIRSLAERFTMIYDVDSELEVFQQVGRSRDQARQPVNLQCWRFIEEDSTIVCERKVSAETNHHRSLVKKKSSSSVINGGFRIQIKTLTGKTIPLRVNKSFSIYDLKLEIRELEGIPCDVQSIIFHGTELENNRTLEHYDIGQNSVVYIVCTLRGAKPAIYLQAPVPLCCVKVSITLRKHWDLTILYPPCDNTDLPDSASDGQPGRQCSWTVSVSHDGTTLTDLKSGLQCSYLFWEAEGTAGRLDQNNHQPHLTGLNTDFTWSEFDPTRPQSFLDNRRSHAIFHVDRLIPYLEDVLAGLTMTPAMRTEFMVYWLPHFQRLNKEDKDIKITFVPQKAFEAAANLEVDCELPVAAVARIFMLFTGIARGNKSTIVAEATKIGDIDWAREIGIDVEGMRDSSTLRVLEWGGMEVPGL